MYIMCQSTHLRAVIENSCDNGNGNRNDSNNDSNDKNNSNPLMAMVDDLTYSSYISLLNKTMRFSPFRKLSAVAALTVLNQELLFRRSCGRESRESSPLDVE